MSKGQRQREYGEIEARLNAATRPPLELRQFGQQDSSYALWEVQVPASEPETCRVLPRQTQATRVIGPFLELVRRYPDAQALRDADVDELRRWFKPLGLTQRANHLVDIAQILVREHNGEVPANLNTLMDLPGIGGYSERAILRLAFGYPYPMIDEGSGRILRRVLGMPFTGRAYSDAPLRDRVAEILPRRYSRQFNLGLLDIGAAFCRPLNPDCDRCPLLEFCIYANDHKSALA